MKLHEALESGKRFRETDSGGPWLAPYGVNKFWTHAEIRTLDWEVEPEPKKKIKLYRAKVFWGHGVLSSSTHWHKDKDDVLDGNPMVLEWEETEVEEE